MNHETAQTTLTGRNKNSKKLANNTYLEPRDGNKFAVKLHATDVVTINADGTFTLSTGGWQSKTTKERINEFSPAGISQRKGVWYLADGSLFKDGMTVDGAGLPHLILYQIKRQQPMNSSSRLSKNKRVNMLRIL